jgi:hypothetical protein
VPCVHCLFSNPTLRGILCQFKLGEAATHRLEVNVKELADITQAIMRQLGGFNGGAVPTIFFSISLA